MRKILTFGVWDFFHYGHLKLFEQCKQYADYLIVAVQNEEYVEKFKPNACLLYNTEQRMEILKSIRIVDEVIPYNIACIEEWAGLDFDILALGEDHTGERFDRIIEWCNQNGKEVVRLKRTQGISSSLIKEKIREISDGRQ